MTDEKIKEVIKQVLYNPQVSSPAISYSITDHASPIDGKGYSSGYIDETDFDTYRKRLEKQLIERLTKLNA